MLFSQRMKGHNPLFPKGGEAPLRGDRDQGRFVATHLFDTTPGAIRAFRMYYCLFSDTVDTFEVGGSERRA
jgi:hypothetical protein